MLCKVYKYGLLPPIKNGEIVNEQMRKMAIEDAKKLGFTTVQETRYE